MTDGHLTDFQLEVARLFFTLPAAKAFVLGGGAGLVAAGLTERPTRDLDFFVSESVVGDAAGQLEEAAADRGWRTERIRDEETFVRLRTDGSPRSTGSSSLSSTTSSTPCTPSRSGWG